MIRVTHTKKSLRKYIAAKPTQMADRKNPIFITEDDLVSDGVWAFKRSCSQIAKTDFPTRDVSVAKNVTQYAKWRHGRVYKQPLLLLHSNGADLALLWYPSSDFVLFVNGNALRLTKLPDTLLVFETPHFFFVADAEEPSFIIMEHLFDDETCRDVADAKAMLEKFQAR